MFIDNGRGALTQLAVRRRISQNRQGLFGQSLNIEEIGEQTVHAIGDHFDDRRRVRRQHSTAARQGVQKRPREDERDREVDVQVAEAQEIHQFDGAYLAGEDELARS